MHILYSGKFLRGSIFVERQSLLFCGFNFCGCGHSSPLCAVQSSFFLEFNFLQFGDHPQKLWKLDPMKFSYYMVCDPPWATWRKWNIPCTYISTTKGTMSCNSCICLESDKQPDQTMASARMSHSQWQTPSHSHRASYQWLLALSLSYRLISQWVTYMCTYHIADNLCGP